MVQCIEIYRVALTKSIGSNYPLGIEIFLPKAHIGKMQTGLKETLKSNITMNNVTWNQNKFTVLVNMLKTINHLKADLPLRTHFLTSHFLLSLDHVHRKHITEIYTTFYLLWMLIHFIEMFRIQWIALLLLLFIWGCNNVSHRQCVNTIRHSILHIK